MTVCVAGVLVACIIVAGVLVACVLVAGVLVAWLVMEVSVNTVFF